MILPVAHDTNKTFPIKWINEVYSKLVSVSITSPSELLHYISIEILGARLGKKLSPALKHTTQAIFGLKGEVKPATQIPVHKSRPTQPAWILPNKVTAKAHSTKSTSPSTTHRQNTVTNSLIPTVFKWIQTPICRYSKQLQSAI